MGVEVINEAVAAKPSGSDGEHTMRSTADAGMQDPIEAGRTNRLTRFVSCVDPQERPSPVRKRKECQLTDVVGGVLISACASFVESRRH